MAKRLTAKVGEYPKDGQTKGRYVNIGVVMENQNGEYILLDPTVSLAGVMQAQNTLAVQKGEQLRDRIMCGVFDDDNQQGGYQQQQGGYQQQPQQGGYQQVPPQQQRQGNPQQGGYAQLPQQQGYQPGPNDPPF